jgi:hypothetical protein
MKYIIIIILSFFLLPSCGKKVMVKGLVYNPVTGEGIPDVKIYVTRPKFTMGYDGAGSKTVYETVTNKYGEFVIERRFQRIRNYRIAYVADPYKYYSVRANVDDIGAHTDGAELTYPLIPVAYLKFNIINHY